MVIRIRRKNDIEPVKNDPGVKRRELLRFATLLSAVTGTSAMGASIAEAAPGDKTTPNTYVPLAEKGSPSGVASLDANAKIPAAQIPSLTTTITAETGITSSDPAHTTKLVPGTGRNGLFIRSEQATYGLKIDQYDTNGAHDTVNIAANFGGPHTPFSVNAGNTTLSTVKIVNSAVQTGGGVIVGVASSPTRTAQVIQADNHGKGASFLATQEPGSTGIGFQIQYLDDGSGNTVYNSRAIWVQGHHTSGSLVFVENDKAQTSGNLMQLVQSSPDATADCLVISPFGAGVGLRVNTSGASTLISAGNFSVDANGTVRTPSIVNYAAFTNSRIQLTPRGTIVDRTVSDNSPVLCVQNASATSTGDVFQAIGISGGVGSRFNRTAHFITAKTTPPEDADLLPNDLAFWFDSTNGAAKFMLKAKQRDGSVRMGAVLLT